MHGFWIYDDYFTPFRNSVPDCCELAAEIASTVGSWATWSGTQSSTLLSKGAFIFDELTRKPTTVRTPDVAFTSYQAQRIVDNFELWKHGGRPYTPTLVVEIDYLSGEHSQLDVLDHKMRNQYFHHGVQLGWLIDPRLECRKMYEYKCNEAGEVYCVDNDQWRDLDGGDVLPGLHISKIGLEMILDW
ncbi:hypothetical protein PHMEG_00018327 [Phytophthora megakarya]|uniref:Putative restriction endonuclease domain-containing protein n=1 Tax=Phytophthora megakarya TaxID=4795 RepID=A0A225VU12_9STRA|nr:hypothetical protein PHMEG_00018327 [Phytophthora megakarya]